MGLFLMSNLLACCLIYLAYWFFSVLSAGTMSGDGGDL